MDRYILHVNDESNCIHICNRCDCRLRQPPRETNYVEVITWRKGSLTWSHEMTKYFTRQPQSSWTFKKMLETISLTLSRFLHINVFWAKRRRQYVVKSTLHVYLYAYPLMSEFECSQTYLPHIYPCDSFLILGKIKYSNRLYYFVLFISIRTGSTLIFYKHNL